MIITSILLHCCHLWSHPINTNTEKTRDINYCSEVFSETCLLKLLFIETCRAAFLSHELNFTCTLCVYPHLANCVVTTVGYSSQKSRRSHSIWIRQLLPCLNVWSFHCLNCTSAVLMVDFHDIFWIIKLYAHSQIRICFKMMLFHFFFTRLIFFLDFSNEQRWKERVYQAYLNVAASLSQNRFYQ